MTAVRKSRTRIAAALAAAGLMVLGFYLLEFPDDSRPRTDNTLHPAGMGETATVERIVDGDTIIVHRRDAADSDRVRLIGIDTPELGHGKGPDECFAREATEILRSLLPEGTEVELRADPTQLQVDKYGRLLRHVAPTETGKSVVQDLLESGAGPEYTYDKPYVGQTEYRDAEATARAQAIGYWGECT